MRFPERYALPVLGVIFMFLVVFWSVTHASDMGFTVPVLIIGAAALLITVAGLRYENKIISILKSLISRPVRTVALILSIAIIFFLVLDLLFGRFYPKVHMATKYGWNVPGNKEEIAKVEDTEGNLREISILYSRHGFKRWPGTDHGYPRVLVMGDSFTQMAYVSNGEEWYSYLEREFPDVAFFVFGGSGYGTLQEYMVMDDFFEGISPQAVIWQFCSNDYSNNYYELDLHNYPFNNHHVRPYLVDTGVVYRLPLPYAALRDYSFSADQVLHLYDGYRRNNAIENLKKYHQQRREERGKLSFAGKESLALLERQSVDVTSRLAGMIRKRVGDIPVYFFNACGKFTDNDRAVCEAGEFVCVDFIGEYVKSLKASGVQVMVEKDGHWNREGNKYVGRKLANYFSDRGGIIPKSTEYEPNLNGISDQ